MIECFQSEIIFYLFYLSRYNYVYDRILFLNGVFMMIKRFLQIFMILFITALNAGVIELDERQSQNYFVNQVCRIDNGIIVKVFYNEYIDESIFDECIKKCSHSGLESKNDSVQLQWTVMHTYGEYDASRGRLIFSGDTLVLSDNSEIGVYFQGHNCDEGHPLYTFPVAVSADIRLPLHAVTLTSLEGQQSAPIIQITKYQILHIPSPRMDLSRATISLSLKNRCISIFVPYKPEPIIQQS